MRIWGARSAALAALAGAAVAVVVAVASVHGTQSTSMSDVNGAVAQLSAVNRKLSGQLEALAPGASPHQAQLTNRSAQAMAKDLRGQFGADDDLGTRMRSLLDAELAYLDAVGSSVANPHSVLLDKVVPRADALRTALGLVPGGEPTDVHGDANLVTFSTARGR